MSENGSATSLAADAGAAAERRIRSIAIVGGGTAGWLAASMLARALPGTGTGITVIESAEIGTVGVGEATIPPIIDVLRFLRIDERDFLQHTNATFKLGIKFTDWKQPGHSYWHPFGTFGAPINRRPFYHCWHRARAAGLEPRFNDFSLCATLGDEGKFRYPDTQADAPAADCAMRCTSTPRWWRSTCGAMPSVSASRASSVPSPAPRAATTAPSTRCSSPTIRCCRRICTSTAADSAEC